MKLLVIEDDKGLANGIAFSMQRDGYEVLCAGTLKKGRELLFSENPDAVLLDLNLPDGDGMDFCCDIRKSSQVPVLMLTARDLETDEVQGLLSGADDYLTKPFSLAVLKARLDTVLRRGRMQKLSGQRPAGGAEGDSGKDGGHAGEGNAAAQESTQKEHPAHGGSRQAEQVLTAGEIRLFPGRMKVYRGEQEVECSATEYRLLYYLMENRGVVLLKEQILEHVWDHTGSFVDENTLQVTMRRLRRKLERDPSNPEYIRTVHGMGYIFV